MGDDNVKSKAVKCLKKCLYDDLNVFEIGVDEAGRGPLFGPVFSAAVILPKDDTFDHSKMKDSKKFHSTKKIQEAAEYIKANAIAWHVSFESETIIDDMNVLQATQKSMHGSIKGVLDKLTPGQENKFHLLIDGNYFVPFIHIQTSHECIPFTLIEGGDNKYSSIAAASILAKVFRDNYIDNLCAEHPDLNEKYGLLSNKGYGTKKHLEGIKEHGITVWHRKTFGICKQYTI